MAEIPTAEHIPEEFPKVVSRPHLTLVVLYSADHAGLASFYNALGVPFASEQHGSGPAHYVNDETETVIEIYPRRENQHGAAEIRLGIATSDLDFAVRAAVANGGTLAREPTMTSRGRQAIVRDPDGRTVELSVDSRNNPAPTGLFRSAWVRAAFRLVCFLVGLVVGGWLLRAALR